MFLVGALYNSDTRIYDFVHILYANRWHLLTLLFFNEEISPDKRSNVISTIILVTVEIYKKIIKGFEWKLTYISANGHFEVGIVFSENLLIFLADQSKQVRPVNVA